MRAATRKSLLLTAVATLAYGGALWGLFNWSRTSGVYHVLSYAFLFLMPVAMGALVNRFAPPDERGTWTNLLWKPAGYVILALTLSLVFHLEGLICVVMAAPLLLAMAALGAYLHFRLSRRLEARAGGRAMVFLALSPLLVAPVENAFDAPMRDVETSSSIRIEAPREVIWENIIRVPAIAPQEIGFGFAKAIGFPDPVEATLSHEGIGGVRRASFRGNVVFTEAIDVWEEGRRISFTITPNTAEIPPSTLDEHVIVGGEYFTVLRGTYEIKEAEDGGFLLELTSRHRSITLFNFYTALWGHLIMSDIQGRILEVIRRRCEGKGAA